MAKAEKKTAKSAKTKTKTKKVTTPHISTEVFEQLTTLAQGFRRALMLAREQLSEIGCLTDREAEVYLMANDFGKLCSAYSSAFEAYARTDPDRNLVDFAVDVTDKSRSSISWKNAAVDVAQKLNTATRKNDAYATAIESLDEDDRVVVQSRVADYLVEAMDVFDQKAFEQEAATSFGSTSTKPAVAVTRKPKID